MIEAYQKAIQFIKHLQKIGLPVSAAYIFGSYAKGTADDNSDIDICIISPVFGKDYFSEMVKLRKIALEIDSRIEPVPFSYQDLEDKYDTLAVEIRKFGKILS